MSAGLGSSDEARGMDLERVNTKAKIGPALLLLTAGLAIILIFATYHGWRAYSSIGALRSNVVELDNLTQGPRSELDVDQIHELLVVARGNISDLRQANTAFGPIPSWFAALSNYGPLIASADDLLLMAGDLLDASIIVSAEARPLAQRHQKGDSDSAPGVAELLASLSDSGPKLIEALTLLESAMTRRAELPLGVTQHHLLASHLPELDRAAGQARSALTAAILAPELLGHEGPRNYLVLVQNDEEIRATGGFVSAAAVISVDDGAIQLVDLIDSYAVDDWQNKPYLEPPDPLQQFLGMDIFLFRDSNFWPHFPTSAEKAISLYEYGQERSIDGAVAFSQGFLEAVLSIVGGVELPGGTGPLLAEDLRGSLREMWNPPLLTDGELSWDRKSFMSPLALALIQRFSADLNIDLFSAGKQLLDEFERKNLQIYSRAEATQDLLAELGAAGSLRRSGQADYLAIVDSNLGFNKVNAVVERASSYNVRLRLDEPAVADLTLLYSNNLSATPVPCRPASPYSARTIYDDLIARCYWNYLRVIAPAGASLISSSLHPVPAASMLVSDSFVGQATVLQETGADLGQFSNLILVPSGSQAEVTFSYQLPEGIVQEDGSLRSYTLQVIRQPGLRDGGLAVKIEFPASWQVTRTSHEGSIGHGSYQLTTELDRDLTLELQFTVSEPH